MEHPSWSSILEVLCRAEGPQPLQSIAKAVGLDASTVHRHLAAMLERGLVKREGERRTQANYSPNELLEINWTGRASSPYSVGSPWLRWTWQASGKMDWRFPLVSRVPDQPARETLWRFLDEANSRGLLAPWLDPPKLPGIGQHPKMDLRWQGFLRELKDPRDPFAMTFVVFGSCARGDARADSDVDLLVLGPHEGDYEWQPFISQLGFQELASEVNLGAPRALQLMVHPVNEFLDKVPRHIRQSVQRDGLTVFHSKSFAGFVEAWGMSDG
jgi:predicted nucleotidyltransferase